MTEQQKGKWQDATKIKPPNNTVVRVKTIAQCYCNTLYSDGEFDYDLDCAESVKRVGMGTADRVLFWKGVTK